MIKETIIEKLRIFFRKYVGRTIDPDEEIFQSGLVNSLFAMQLVLFVEKEFGVAVTNDDLDLANFRSLNATSDFIQAKIA
jgi:methoxymalonate biosynthesis acyl carrier protein